MLRNVGVALALGVLLSAFPTARVVAFQQRARPSFEAFAKGQGVWTLWIQPTGELNSVASRAAMYAVVLADSTGTTRRGLRIDLRHRTANVTCPQLTHGRSLCAEPNPAIWLEEDDLDRVRAGVVRGNFDNLIGRYWGSEPRPGHGLKIGGFTFADRTLEEVLSLLDRGRKALASAPAAR